MAFSVSAALLDAMVLAVVGKEETYGYKITQELCETVQVSESTLYPVLRRLQKSGCLETYDKAFQGRNRRYYRITEQGGEMLDSYRSEWREYSAGISRILNDKGDNVNGQI
ncbi:MAG: PadR family transcriptional regulator [Ruminococcus sp.]|nr:PadR family transcriptional regulator [Oscillospiraceae bacterium]